VNGGLATLGFAARTGWAAMVALRGPLSDPQVIDRRRVQLATGGAPTQVYHAARELPPAAAEGLVAQAHEAARDAARKTMRGAVTELEQTGYRVIGAGLILASGRLPAALSDILASHALLHAAEGELFRDALADAAAAAGLAVTGVPGRSLYAQAAAALGLRGDEVAMRVTALGRPIGPPWRREHKEAALIAWLALAVS